MRKTILYLMFCVTAATVNLNAQNLEFRIDLSQDNFTDKSQSSTVGTSLFLQKDLDETLIELSPTASFNALVEMERYTDLLMINSEINMAFMIISLEVPNNKSGFSIHYFTQAGIQMFGYESAIDPSVSTKDRLDLGNSSEYQIFNPSLQHGIMIEFDKVYVEYLRDDIIDILETGNVSSLGVVELGIYF